MKTWKSFYLLALAATLAFTGCKKDDEDEGASQTGKLTVGQTNTRSAPPKIGPPR